MSMQLPSSSLLGYLVLNASKTPYFPFIPPNVEVNQHIEGAVNGSTVCVATESHHFFYPQRGRNYTFNSVQNYHEPEAMKELMSSFANIQENSHDGDGESEGFHGNLHTSIYDKVQENSLLSIEQHRPFGITAIVSKGIDLQMFGLHTAEQSLLVWTNLASYEDMLQREYGDAFWLYRFRTRRDLTSVIFSRRICSRWYRWSQQPNFKSPAARFPALEKALFSKQPSM